jgi:hypothetical protein
MKLIHTKEELDKIYPYRKYKPTHYPKKFPCLVEYVSYDYGIAGSGWGLNVIDIPENIKDIESFIIGVNAEREVFPIE